MEETHYHAKRMRPLGKRRVAAMAAGLVLLLGIAAAGVRYFDFVSRTVYEESTAHLAEVLHQSNNMLNEVVEMKEKVEGEKRSFRRVWKEGEDEF